MRIPSEQTTASFKQIVASKHPALSDVWAALDGICIEKSGDQLTQSRFYNGWTHDHYITNSLGFYPIRTICFACLNVPGCMHASTVCEWGGIYEKLDDVTEAQ